MFITVQFQVTNKQKQVKQIFKQAKFPLARKWIVKLLIRIENKGTSAIQNNQDEFWRCGVALKNGDPNILSIIFKY